MAFSSDIACRSQCLERAASNLVKACRIDASSARKRSSFISTYNFVPRIASKAAGQASLPRMCTIAFRSSLLVDVSACCRASMPRSICIISSGCVNLVCVSRDGVVKAYVHEMRRMAPIEELRRHLRWRDHFWRSLHIVINAHKHA